MIKLFTQRQPIVFVLLIVLLFLLRLPFLYSSQTYTLNYTNYTFFGDFFLLLNQNKLVSYFGGAIIILLQTLHLNYIFEKHGVQYKSTFLPALFYVLFCSLLNILDANITPALIAQTPAMIALGIYFDLYKSNAVRTKIFTALFMLGIGSLIYLPLAFFPLVFLINIFFVKIPSIRDLLLVIAGALLPVYFTFVFCYFSGQYELFMDKINLLVLFDTKVVFEQTKTQLILFGFLGTITLVTSVKLYMNYFRNIIKTRIIQQMFFVYSFISLLLLIFLLDFQYQHLMLFAIPFSYIFSYFFMGKWKFMLNEIIAIGMLIFILIIKFYHL